MDSLDSEEKQRYSRHLALPEIGLNGQLRLKAAKVLVVGAGGLGAPVLMYLSAAGVGHLGIVDNDQIDISNLQRQILYSVDDVGKYKASMAAKRLAKLNPLVKYAPYVTQVSATNAELILGDFDFVVDCTDNFATRYLLNDACVIFQKTLIHASILRFEGHVSVFNAPREDGTRSATYRDLFPLPPSPESVPNCADAGVIGVIAGIIGCLQANEVIKLITGSGAPLINQLLVYDCLTNEQRIVRFRDRQARDKITAFADYEDFCGINDNKIKSLNELKNSTMKEVTVQELKKLKDSGADFQLIDVREPHEYEICHLDGELIPMSEIPYNVDKISKDKQVVIHCRSGKRSGDMLLWLEKNHGFNNLYNLKGGVLSWAKEIDPSMPTY